MIFRIGHVWAIYFDMIALSGWQVKIVMSPFIPTPNDGRCWSKTSVCHISLNIEQILIKFY